MESGSAGGYEVSPSELLFWRDWVADLGGGAVCPQVECIRQGWGELQCARSVVGTPLTIGEQIFHSGFGTHGASHIHLNNLGGAVSFTARVGADRNCDSLTSKNPPKLRFRVLSRGRLLLESPELTTATGAWLMELTLDGHVDELDLLVDCDHEALAHADWADLRIVNRSGRLLEPGLGLPRTGWLPVSFMIGEMESDEFFRRWGVTHRERECGIWTEHDFVSGGAAAGLEVELKLRQFRTLPAVEWDLRLSNPGKNDSGRISNFRFLKFENSATKLFRGHGSCQHGRGAAAYWDSFAPVPEDLTPESRIEFSATAGRSSVEWMPYFNAFDELAECGFVFGAGWSGQWSAEVGMRGCSLQLEDFSARLRPGESLCMPSALAIHYRGTELLRGQNLLRRHLHEHILPRDGAGRPLQLPLAQLTWGGMPEEEHLKRLEFLRRNHLPFDCYWIDAGWYGPEGTVSPDEFDTAWGENTGNWKFNPTILPAGLKNISRAAHAAGVRQLLWMEPERAVAGTEVTREHPGWFLREHGSGRPGDSLLLDLGNPAAWEWCFETIVKIIDENGVDCFRQDFNLSPRPYWMAADEAEGRAGIHEVQYINGLYRLWRELKRKFPALLIDNCATGGRRLDFAALRYTVPLWGSDMSCFPDVRAEWQQEHVFGLSYWLPEFSFGTQNQSGGDSYMFRSAAAAGVVVHLFSYQRTPVSAEYPVEWLFRMLEEAREAAPCHAGDFYPLTEYTHTHRAWQVWQFDRPDLGTGVLKIFRSAASPYERGRFCLRGLHPERIYQLYTVAEDDGGGSVPEGEFTGRELLETGLELTLTMPRSSRVIFYRRVLESGKTDTYYAAEPKESIQQDA